MSCGGARSVPHKSKDPALSAVYWDRIVVDFDGILNLHLLPPPAQDNKSDERDNMDRSRGRGGSRRRKDVVTDR